MKIVSLPGAAVLRWLDHRPGLGAGYDGGRVVFEGIPAELVAARSTLTGEHLAAFVGSGAEAVLSR